MKYILFITYLVLMPGISSFAQHTSIPFELQKNDGIIDVVAMSGNGIMVKTGKTHFLSRNSKNVHWQLHYLGSGSNKKWTIQLEKEKIDVRYPTVMFPNISGTKLYHIEKIGKPGGNIIQEIDLNAKIRRHIIEKDDWKEYKPGNLKAAFASDKYICYLSTINKDETHNKKKAEEELKMYRIESADFTKKSITLQLPKLTTDLKKTSFWAYENHDNEGIYLSSVYYEEGTPVKVEHQIIKVNYEGKVIEKTLLNYTRDNAEKLAPIASKGPFCRNDKAFIGDPDDYVSTNFGKYPDITQVRKGFNGVRQLAVSATDLGTTSSLPEAERHDQIETDRNLSAKLIRGLSSVKIDPINKCAYVYGMDQLDNFKHTKISSNPADFNYYRLFIMKFDLDGNKIWEHSFEEFGTVENLRLFFYQGLNGIIELGFDDLKDYLKWQISTEGNAKLKAPIRIPSMRNNRHWYNLGLTTHDETPASKYCMDNELHLDKNNILWIGIDGSNEYLLDMNESNNVMTVHIFNTP